MKIAIAPNAFKGSLTALEVAAAMEEGIKNAMPEAECVRVPVSDGGDGLVYVAHAALGGELRKYKVRGPRHGLVEAEICHVPRMELVAIEMAQASGLALLREAEQDPTLTTTYGTGQLIRAGLDLGAQGIVIGIGGSATNDGGIGMAQALGVRFLDANDREVAGVGASLPAIKRIDVSGLDPRVKQTRLEVACDVANPLTGPRGAAAVYGPQKGATPQQVEELDAGLNHLAQVIERDLGMDVRTLTGSGAAGGSGAGLHAFLGAELRKGIELVFALIGLNEKIKGADLVLTGEGQIDNQTVFDKAPAAVGAAAKAQMIPCFAIAGSVGDDLGDLHTCGIDAMFSLCSAPMTLEEAMTEGSAHIKRTAEQVARAFLSSRSARSCRGHRPT